MTRVRANDPTTRGRLPVQSRDRRPALAALALLLVVAGGLGAALVVYRSGQKTDVLVASHEIKPGTVISADDFDVARVSNDSGVVVKASDESVFIGTYALTDIPASTLVNPKMFRKGHLLPSSGMIVGVSVAPNLQPAAGFSAGDIVRAYLAPKSGGDDVASTVLVNAALVTDVSTSEQSGTTIVSLLVTSDSAPALVLGSAQGTVALALLPPGTTPVVDFQRGGS